VGASLGAVAANLYELFDETSNNLGDKKLGALAAEWGAALSNGSLQPGALGDKIRNELCKK